MSAKKFAISVPEEVMDQVDRAARGRGVTRSRFISDVLRRVAHARRDAEVTRRIDELFADPKLQKEQKGTADDLLSASSKQDHLKW